MSGEGPAPAPHRLGRRRLAAISAPSTHSELISGLDNLQSAPLRTWIGVLSVGSALVGATGGLAANLSGLTAGSGITSLGIGTPYGAMANAELNALIGATQRGLIKELLGGGKEGAVGRLANLRIPNGLTPRTLRIYQEVARRVVEQGPNAPGYAVQSLRLKIVEQALRMLR
jgi:hypothetical protein